MSNANTNEFAGLVNHTAIVEGGKKLPEGTTVEVTWVGKNKFGGNTARIVCKDKPEVQWYDPKHLKKGKALPKERIAALEAQREAEKSESVLVIGTVRVERDKSVLIDMTGWKGHWFAKEHAQIVGEFEDGKKLFDLPVWKIRKDSGQGMVDALISDQDAITAKAKAAGIEI